MRYDPPMWFLDGLAVTSVIAATKRPEPMPLKEWLELDNPLDGAGPAAEKLRTQLEAAADGAARPWPPPQPES